MTKCKKDMCKEQAVYHRRWGHKRYCETHGHAYADRRDTALVARARMHDCDSGISPSCEGKVRPSRHADGHTACQWCEEQAEELNRRHEYEDRKQKRFEDAKTVEEMKAWIMEYMV